MGGSLRAGQPGPPGRALGAETFAAMMIDVAPDAQDLQVVEPVTAAVLDGHPVMDLQHARPAAPLAAPAVPVEDRPAHPRPLPAVQSTRRQNASEMVSPPSVVTTTTMEWRPAVPPAMRHRTVPALFSTTSTPDT